MRPCPHAVWTKKGGARRGARGPEQRGLVGFDLQEVVASFFHDDARGFFLAVERVGGDGFAVERGQGGEELLGGLEFAARGVFFLIHDGEGDGGAVFDFDQADHADDVADHFSVQGERAGQGAGLRAEPAAEQRGEGLGVHAREHFVEDVVAGHLVKAARAFLARQSQLRALRGLESRGKARDFRNLPRAAQQRHGHDGEHRPDAEARVFPARIGRAPQHFEQAAALRLGAWQHAVRGLHQRARVLRRQRHRARLAPRVQLEFLHPKPLGPSVGDEKIRAMPAVAIAHAHRLPAAGLVTGPAVTLRIGETLGQQRTVAETLLPLRGQRTARSRQRRAGQIGLRTFFMEQQIAAVLHDELEPLGGQRRIPTDPALAILELERRRPPHQQRHPLPVAHHHLAQEITHRRQRAEVMLLREQRIEAPELRGRDELDFQ